MGVRKWPNRSLCSSRSTPLSSLESLFPSSMSSLQFTLPTTCSLHLPLFLLPSLNPLPYLARYPEADVLISSDQLIPTVVDDSLEGENDMLMSVNVASVRSV
ncbi:uncharacterized protein LOC110270941 [Arachis ipaensis]|uniref:uncharacterized protein LOC110270941 n=1 Tax=Arachis ipaensis TaxID=130454 RepID=UPI000A2B6CD9|nr:uncharacterized protein LOC110270941 [Arachis ipaensis]